MKIAHPGCFEPVRDERDEVRILARGEAAEKKEGEQEVLIGVCCMDFGSDERMRRKRGRHGGGSLGISVQRRA